MNQKMLNFIILVFVGLSTFAIGSKVHFYFTHNQKPHLALEGLEHEHSYKSELNCSVITDNAYKVDMVKALLDGKPYALNHDGRIGSKKGALPISLDTTTLADGKHTIEFEMVDSSRNKNKNSVTINFYVDNTPLHAAFLEENVTVAQGKTLHLKIKVNKLLKDATLTLGSKSYPAYQADLTSTMYECFIPIDCEELPGELALTAQLCDAVQNTIMLKNKITIQEFAFKKQKRWTIDEQQKLEAEKEISNNNQVLEDAIQKWTKDSVSQKLWKGPFEIPTQVIKIVTPHGEIRMTPVRGRYMHKGIDVTNHPRSVIWAAQNGKIIIKDRFLLTGNTVVIDHGCGISTLYAHLEDFAEIEVGDMVKKGNPIGKLGKTGYATGYHLHWELRVQGVAVDPLEWTKNIY